MIRRVPDLRDREGTAEAGMTLLELMLAIGVLVLMMGLAWGILTRTSQNADYFSSYEQRTQQIRSAMARVVADFEAAYLSSNEDQTLTDRRTMFVAVGSGTVPEIRFSTLGHTPSSPEANESEQTLISYSAARDPNDAGKTNWLRRETRRLANKNWRELPGVAEVLLPDIEEVKFSFWNAAEQKWIDRWDSTAESERGKLPTRVKIDVSYKNAEGDVVKLQTQARLLMSEMVKGR